MRLASKMQKLNDYIESTMNIIKKKAEAMPKDEKNWEILNSYFLSVLKDENV